MVAHEVTYLIGPKQDLIDFVTQQYPAFVDLSKQKYVWKTTQGGRGEPTPQERIITYKLLFLAEIRSIVIYRKEPEHEALLEAIMGKPPFDERAFDQWWIIERIPSIIEFEDHLEIISLDQFQLIAKTGLQRVDGWIENLQEMKENGEI